MCNMSELSNHICVQCGLSNLHFGWDCLYGTVDLTIEHFHGKTYNLDWRHNLLKRRHKLVGEKTDL